MTTVRTPPRNPRAAQRWLDRARTLARQGRRKEARVAFEQAVTFDPLDVQTRVLLANLLVAMGDLDAAMAVVDDARELAPEAPGPRAVGAQILQRRGDLEGAWQLVAGRGDDIYLVEPVAMLALARGRPEQGLPIVRAGLNKAPPSVKPHFWKHEGDLLDAIGDRAGAFEAWTRSNRARGLSFSPQVHRAEVTRIVRGSRGPWSSATLPEAERPVLVVGVPRSGTSLLEQALGCHPEVAPGGELSALTTLSRQVGGDGAGWVDGLSTLPDSRWVEAGRAYLAALERIDRHAPRVTDKMPHNFTYLGVLARMLPGARVIVCERDPVDAGFSCFRQMFNAHHPWATDIDWIADYITGARKLIAHARRTFPLRFHVVRYEALVAEPEPTLRGVLDFLEVGWDPAVLAPETLERDVRTASALEVRAPIHTGSVDRAAPYIDKLGPLVALRGG